MLASKPNANHARMNSSINIKAKQISNAKPLVLIPGFAGSKLVSAKEPNSARNEFVNLQYSHDSEWSQRITCTTSKQVVPHDFGGVDGIRNLCPMCESVDWYIEKVFKTRVIDKAVNYKYYGDMIDMFENRGYTTGVDLIGAPYDFRVIAMENDRAEFYKNLKDIIEETVEATGKRAVIVSHSIGCILFYVFLTDYVDSEWKQKHISTFVSVSGPYGGCSMALKTVVSGIALPEFLKERYHKVFENCHGLALAMPNNLSYDKDEVIVVDSSTGAGYNVHNYNELLPENMQATWDIVQKQITSFFKNTEVATTFVVSLDKPTEYQYVYDTLRKEPIKVLKVPGDNVIHQDSLMFHRKHNVMYSNYDVVKLKNQEHTKILQSTELFDLVYSRCV